jgi:hypothetical protein
MLCLSFTKISFTRDEKIFPPPGADAYCLRKASNVPSRFQPDYFQIHKDYRFYFTGVKKSGEN